MRQSVAPHRVSHAPNTTNNTTNSNPASANRLSEKKKEYEAVTALERASALFVKRIESLADDCQVMADAGHVHGRVLEQWPNMFAILGLFLANRRRWEETEESGSMDGLESSAPGERLVRIPLDELQADSSEPQPL